MKKCDERKNGQRVYANVHGLRNGALQPHRLALERRDEGVISGAPAQFREGTQILKTADYTRPDLRNERQEPSINFCYNYSRKKIAGLSQRLLFVIKNFKNFNQAG